VYRRLIGLIGPSLLLAVLTLGACAPAAPLLDPPAVAPLAPAGLPPAGLPNGVAAGDVSQDAAVLWARAAAPGVVTFTLASLITPVEPQPPRVLTRTVADPWLPVTVSVPGLTPATAYAYTATTASGDAAGGRFRTPAAEQQRGLRFGASGDVYGALAPYPALANAPGRELDFFVMLGDSIYAEFPSPAVPKQAQTLAEFQYKQAEVLTTQRGQNTLAALRAATALFATIDDHEVLNNFAGGQPAAESRYFAEDSGLINQTRLYRAALDAFFAYHPLRFERYGPGADADRMQNRPKLYRYRTFGRDAALLLLDMRSMRDAPLPGPKVSDDDAAVAAFGRAAFTPGRTVLGAQQLAMRPSARRCCALSPSRASPTWSLSPPISTAPWSTTWPIRTNRGGRMCRWRPGRSRSGRWRSMPPTAPA
jgi:phosphodiesterase/alkaline phosphatase D-like protein